MIYFLYCRIKDKQTFDDFLEECLALYKKRVDGSPKNIYSSLLDSPSTRTIPVHFIPPNHIGLELSEETVEDLETKYDKRI